MVWFHLCNIFELTVLEMEADWRLPGLKDRMLLEMFTVLTGGGFKNLLRW